MYNVQTTLKLTKWIILSHSLPAEIYAIYIYNIASRATQSN